MIPLTRATARPAEVLNGTRNTNHGGIMGREDQGVAVSRHRYQVIPRTLCFVMHGTEVLLLLGGAKKRLWAGRYNGLGGHVEQDEDIYTSVRREVHEEAGLEVHDLRLRGVVHADAGDPVAGILFFVFTATTDDKNVLPSDEGTLEWWPTKALPTDRLVEDLPVLLPKVLSMGPTDPPLFVAYSYDDDNRLVIQFAEQV
jgi:8-oxo-dGTP diphosphatase